MRRYLGDRPCLGAGESNLKTSLLTKKNTIYFINSKLIYYPKGSVERYCHFWCQYFLAYGWFAAGKVGMTDGLVGTLDVHCKPAPGFSPTFVLRSKFEE